MKLAKKNLIITLITVIIIFSTIAIFLISPYKKIAMDYYILITVAVSEIVASVFILILNSRTDKGNVLVASGGYTTVVIYLILNIVVGILFGAYFRTAITAYRIISILILSFFVIIVLLLTYLGKRFKESMLQSKSDSEYFSRLIGEIDIVMQNPLSNSYISELEELRDDILCCDQGIRISDDQILDKYVNKLVELIYNKTDAEEIRKCCMVIRNYMKNRMIKISQKRIGGI